MLGFCERRKKELIDAQSKLREERHLRELSEKNLTREKQKTDNLVHVQEEAIKSLIGDNMTGYVKCGNELLKVCVQSFSGSQGELPEINCVVIKDA